MNESTRKLVEAMEQTGDPRLDPVIEKAKEEHYHDFGTTIAFPTMQLIADLRTADAPEELVNRVIEGEFDATLEEARAWMRDQGLM